MSDQDGIALVAILAAGIVAFAVLFQMQRRRAVSRRLRLALGDPADRVEARLGAGLLGGMDTVMGILAKLMPLGAEDQGKIRSALRRADIDTEKAFAAVVGAKVGCVLLGAAAGLVIGALTLGGVIGWLVGLGGGFLGGIILNLLPELFVAYLGRRRMRFVSNGLLDAFDLMVISLESGVTFDGALRRTVASLMYLWPDLARELRRALIDISVHGRPRADALARVSARIDSEELRDLGTIVGQSDRYGTPLADALRKLASSLRISRTTQIQEKAGRLPTLLVLPTIGGMIPGLMVIVAGPAFSQLSSSLQGFTG